MLFRATFFTDPFINIIVKNGDAEKQSVSHELSLRLVILMFPREMHQTEGDG